jgi:hypothetical protein
MSIEKLDLPAQHGRADCHCHHRSGGLQRGAHHADAAADAIVHALYHTWRSYADLAARCGG